MRLFRPLSSWYLTTLAVNAGGSAVDHSLLQLTSRLTTLPSWGCISIGLVAGSAISFFVNRRFTFRNRLERPLSEEAARFIAVMLLLGALHGVFAESLRRFGAPLVASKMAADFLIIGLNSPWMLKRFVFAAATPCPAIAPDAAA